ncbi:MAG: hypothetical protein QXI58_03500 [Candidatus Micrarchaeia archaeon]
MVPEEVIAISKEGKREVRILIERGEYVRYGYADPKTLKIIKEGKESIWLKSNGKIEHLFFIPIKGKFLVIKEKDTNIKGRKIWDKEKKKAVELFE